MSTASTKSRKPVPAALPTVGHDRQFNVAFGVCAFVLLLAGFVFGWVGPARSVRVVNVPVNHLVDVKHLTYTQAVAGYGTPAAQAGPATFGGTALPGNCTPFVVRQGAPYIVLLCQ